MKNIKDTIVRQQVIEFVENSSIYKTMIDQLVNNNFKQSNVCVCEILPEFKKQVEDCYDKHFGGEIMNYTPLLVKFCQNYYDYLVGLVEIEAIDVYDDDVFYLTDENETLSMVSDYLATRNKIINDHEIEIDEILYSTIFEHDKKEEKKDLVVSE